MTSLSIIKLTQIMDSKFQEGKTKCQRTRDSREDKTSLDQRAEERDTPLKTSSIKL